jgi:hypothetical protein
MEPMPPLLFLICCVLFFFPSLVALSRRHHSKLAIFVANGLLLVTAVIGAGMGFTLIALGILLVWACTSVRVDTAAGRLRFSKRSSGFLAHMNRD